MRLALVLALASACGPARPFLSQVDGDRPLLLQPTERLHSASLLLGDPPGARWTLLQQAIPWAQTLWNPVATGEPRVIPIDVDDDLDGTCATRNFALWSVAGVPAIYVCARWAGCWNASQSSSLLGFPGCLHSLLHELGHVLGARIHTTQEGRVDGRGSIMCGWSGWCGDPALTDWTAEDVALICADGGHGGRCAR